MGRIGAGLGKVKDKALGAAGTAADKAGTAVKDAEGPSPNPMTNLIITDIALRGGGRLLRNVVEKNLLGVKYPPEKAKALVTGRGMAQTLIGTAIARVATKSVPGALLVGGGLLAKTLYDRRKGHAAREKGEAQVDRRARKAPKV
jgi:hypothetical protein